MSARVLSSCCALLLGGCHTPLTEIVVVVDTDLEIVEDIDAVRVEVDATRIGALEVVERDAALTGPNASALPIVIGILHDGAGPLGPIDVRVIGLRDESERVTSLARTDFIEQSSLVLRMSLLERCVNVDCNGHDTCGANGACVDGRIDAATLPLWSSIESADAMTSPDAGIGEL